MIKNIIKFLKNEVLLTISGALAIASAFIIPPDMEYIGYLNLPVLSLLFCLMVIVAGIKKAGAFEVLTERVFSRIHSEKAVIGILCALCFLSSALITNDVALITFVPFSLMLFKDKDEGTIVFLTVMETIAANLGSLITPIGNPQNLYLYTYFNLNPAQFFRIALPLGGLCGILIGVIIVFYKNKSTSHQSNSAQNRTTLQRTAFILHLILFTVCLLTVLKIIPYITSFIIVTASVMLYDKKLFLKADYILLLTFICFFILIGNIARIPAISSLLSKVISGRELLSSVLLSQIISNVPAATMLSAFTDNASALILGTNIGGLGTPIASMASLITYRYISSAGNISKGRFLKLFSIYNFGLLIILTIIYTI